MNLDSVWKSLLVEFLGTFTLVFVGGSAVALTVNQSNDEIPAIPVGDRNPLVPSLAFGFIFAILFYIFGCISGAHLNPSVSFGFALAGRMHWGLMIGYWIVQILGAIAGAALVLYFFGSASGSGDAFGILTNTDAGKAVLMEAFLTFFLVLAILLVTKNPMYAIASGFIVGLTLAADMFVGYNLTGASTNPARSLGTGIFAGTLGTWWIYFVGPFIGAIVAAIFYRIIAKDWSCHTKLDCNGNPVVDECGNVVKECKRKVVDRCGKTISSCEGDTYEMYLRKEAKMDHMQQTPIKAIGEWLSSNGVNPVYIKQEVDREISKHVEASIVEPKYNENGEKIVLKSSSHVVGTLSSGGNVERMVEYSPEKGNYNLNSLSSVSSPFSPRGSSPTILSPLGSSPLGSSPLGSSPLGSSPLGSSPLNYNSIGSSPLGSSPLNYNSIGSSPLGSSPLGYENVYSPKGLKSVASPFDQTASVINDVLM